MTKLVCVQCQCELRPETNETVVVETASFGPYKVWNADTWKCPGCGIEIVAGFAEQPMRQDHYAEDFQGWLEAFLATAERIEYDHEKPQPPLTGNINSQLDLSCSCDDWKIGMPQIIAAQIMSQLHHGEKYTGKIAGFCPWCGRKLTKADSFCPSCHGTLFDCTCKDKSWFLK